MGGSIELTPRTAIEAAYKDHQADGVPDKAFDALELRRYDYHRRRFGFSGEFDFTPAEGQRLYARASIAGYNEHVTRNRLEIDGLGDAVTTDPLNPNGFIASDASAQKTLRDEDETHRNAVFQVGGEHHFGEVKFDWFGAYSRAAYSKHYDYNSSFAGPQNLAIAYDNTTSPNFPAFGVVGGPSITNSADYQLSDIGNSVEHDRDREWSYAGNLAVPLHLTDDDELKIGGKLRYRRKTANPLTEDDPYTGANGSLNAYQAGGPYTYYDGHYAIGYGIDPNAIRGLIKGSGVAFGPGGGDFDDVEDISAGYIQYHAAVGALGVLAGVRVEHTAATYSGTVSTTAANGRIRLSHASQRRSYTNVFPTIQLRYQVAPKLVARATYSTGIARPGFYQTTQSASVDIGGGSVSIGNPALKPTTGNNFDVAIEYYLPANGILSLGLFDKQFDNYIVARTTRGSYPGIDGIATIDTYQNVSHGYARGIEAAFVDRFTGLPGLLAGLGIDSNFTYVKSAVDVRTGEKVPLPGTFKYTGNASAFYERGPAKIRLAGQYESAVLFGVGGSRLTDIFQDKRFTLDLNASYQFDKAIQLYANVKNLTNAPLRFYEGTANRPIQREFYDATIEGGVKLRF